MNEIFQKLDDCVHCGLCLSDCPTYLTTGLESESPRGRLMIMKMMHQEKTYSPAFQHLNTCLDCRGCVTACPSGVEYDKLLDETRKKFSDKLAAQKILVNLIVRFITHKFWMNIIHKILWVLQKTGLLYLLTIIPLHSFRNLKGFPNLKRYSFSKTSHEILPAIGKKKGEVTFFYGCVMDNIYSKVHTATVRILQWNGYEVHLPKNQVCCGALDHHTGSRKKMEKLQLINQKVFEKFDTIIINSAGCGSEMKSIQTNGFGPKVKDLTEFLCEIDCNLPDIEIEDEEVYYDAPCHLVHGQGLDEQPKIILKIFGYNIVENNEEKLCCGAAGSYVFSHPNQSAEILQRKMNYIKNVSNIKSIVTANPGCQLQLQKGCKENKVKIPVYHICELIYDKYMKDPEFAATFREN